MGLGVAEFSLIPISSAWVEGRSRWCDRKRERVHKICRVPAIFRTRASYSFDFVSAPDGEGGTRPSKNRPLSSKLLPAYTIR